MTTVSPLIRPATSDAAAEPDAAVHSRSRLAAVGRSGLLDSAPEEAFDALIRMAATLLKAPAGFVSVVDSERDFYKSQVGFPDTLAEARELTGPTFCHHMLDRDVALVIEDTHADPTWRSVPTVDTLGVRAYAGIPLRLDGESIGSFCVIDTEPRRWSAEELGMLEQLALSAERELGLRVALRDAREESARSQALVRAREEIVAVVAHDLRTPLQVLRLSTALLQRTCTPEQKIITARMSAATDAMKQMADELLTEHVSLPVAQARRESVGAAKLLGDVADTMALIAGRAQIGLRLGDIVDAQLSIDYAELLRVFCNLVGNSIKYSAAGSVVSLSAARDGDSVRLRVADTGRGMSADEQRHAFERGWQGVEGLARGDGAGLGLPIVKTLIERNGGRVELASEIDRGTTVTVSLPCR